MASNKKGGVLSKVPLPDTFFSIKHQLRPIASLNVSAPSAILVYLLTIGGFVGSWLFYSQPNPPVTVTLVQSEWQKAGYECNPLQKESVYETMWSYDTCISNVQQPTTDNVITTSVDDNKISKYYPFGSSYASLPYELADEGMDNCVAENSASIFDGIYDVGCHKSGMTVKNNQPARATNGWFVTLLQNCWSKTITDNICAHFKENPPFQCAKTEVNYKSELEKLSLSIANTQLLYGVLSTFFAYMFYKMKKNAEISPTDGGGWQEAMGKLKEELTTLRMKVDKHEKQMV